MAYTTSILAKTVMGDQRVHFMRVTSDAATGVVASGFDVVEFISTALQSASTASVKFAINELCAGTGSVGNIGVTGSASGDEYLVTIYGR